jgi:hypothetical protein
MPVSSWDPACRPDRLTEPLDGDLEGIACSKQSGIGSA